MLRLLGKRRDGATKRKKNYVQCPGDFTLCVPWPEPSYGQEVPRTRFVATLSPTVLGVDSSRGSRTTESGRVRFLEMIRQPRREAAFRVPKVRPKR